MKIINPQKRKKKTAVKYHKIITLFYDAMLKYDIVHMYEHCMCMDCILKYNKIGSLNFITQLILSHFQKLLHCFPSKHII